MDRYKPFVFPTSDSDALERRRTLVAVTKHYLDRTGALGHRELQCYARQVKRVTAEMATLLVLAQQRYDSTCDALDQCQDVLGAAESLIETTERRASSWNPIPYLRRVPVRQWVPLVWDHTVSVMLRAVLRGVRFLAR